MSEWKQTRVLTAALFTGRSLLVQVMTFTRGSSTLLELRVGPQREDDPKVNRWRHGDCQAYPPVPPVWPLEKLDPWEAASYIGPLPGAGESDPGQSCRSCGAPRADGAKHCGQCGTQFDVAESLLAVRLAGIVGDIAIGSLTAGADLGALIEAYAEGLARSGAGRVELLKFIEADFAQSASARFIRGETAGITPSLTLGSAQDIQQTVATTGRIRPEQIRHAELLLRYAPLHFGYWGPFKALVKAVPVDDLPDAYADALARLSCEDRSRPAPSSVHIEDTGFLKDFVDTASDKTLAYLARRVRRDLVALAKRSPDSYARVAARMILSWDRNLSRNSYAPAYVMLGARGTLDEQSHRVVVDPDMSSRRDAHPEIWNERPALVQRIFDSVKNSVAAHTWSFQVLESLGQAPAITIDHLKLALLSTYPSLNLAACSALTSRPGSWGSLAVEHWIAFFRKGDDSSIDAVLDAMTVGTVRRAAVQAAGDLLISDAPRNPSRQLRLALMFLSATKPMDKKRLIDDADADVAAVITVVTQSAMKYKKLWNPIIKGLDIEHLERISGALTDGASDSNVLSAIGDQIIRKRAEQADPSDAINWIASDNPLEAKLGWRLLNAGYGVAGLVERLPQWIHRRLPTPLTVERVMAELFPRASVDDAPQLAEILPAALDRGVERSDLLAFLVDTPLGPAVLWHAIAAHPGSDSAALADMTPEAVRATGDARHPEQLGSATAEQLSFVLRYITENPGRIAGDVRFGVAAAATTDLALQAEAIRQLQANGQMPQVWGDLVESLSPAAFAAGRDHVATLRNPREFRDAVQECLRSDVPAKRDLGMQLLDDRRRRSADPALWAALAESDDSRIQELVAAEALRPDRVDDEALLDFDRRVLVAPGGNRRTKESVKARLDMMSAELGPSLQQRIVALLELARGETLRDREWALGKLAELALAGVHIDGLEVSLVTTGDAS